MEWGKMKGSGYYMLLIFKTPAGSGRVRLINHATIPQRWSIAVVMTRRSFRRVCPSLKITERRTWHDRFMRRFVTVETVCRCIRQ